MEHDESFNIDDIELILNSTLQQDKQQQTTTTGSKSTRRASNNQVKSPPNGRRKSPNHNIGGRTSMNDNDNDNDQFGDLDTFDDNFGMFDENDLDDLADFSMDQINSIVAQSQARNLTKDEGYDEEENDDELDDNSSFSNFHPQSNKPQQLNNPRHTNTDNDDDGVNFHSISIPKAKAPTKPHRSRLQPLTSTNSSHQSTTTTTTTSTATTQPSRLERIVNDGNTHSIGRGDSALGQNRSNFEILDRPTRSLQPPPQTFHDDEMSYDAYMSSYRKLMNANAQEEYNQDDSMLNEAVTLGNDNDDNQGHQFTVNFDNFGTLSNSNSFTPTTKLTTPSTRKNNQIVPLYDNKYEPNSFSTPQHSTGSRPTTPTTPSAARLNNLYNHSRLHRFPHPFDTPSTSGQSRSGTPRTPTNSRPSTPSSFGSQSQSGYGGDYSRFAFEQTALPGGYDPRTQDQASTFPLLDDSISTFYPYYEEFLQYNIWGLGLRVLHPQLLKPLYQTCLRLRSVPILTQLQYKNCQNWSQYALKHNIPVVNNEVQAALIPGLEEPSLKLLGILTNAIKQRSNSHSLVIGGPDDLPVLCVGSVLAHILYSPNSTKLNAVIIHLSGHVSTNDTVSISSLCTQLCEQFGLTCNLDPERSTFHEYAQFITLLFRQISTLDVEEIQSYDSKYHLYEHGGIGSGTVEDNHIATRKADASTSHLTALPIIVVLDGFDNFAQTSVTIDDNSSKGVSRQSFLYFLGDLAQTNQAWLHIIGIVTSPISYDYLEKRVKSRFPMQNIFLHNSIYQIGNLTPSGGEDDNKNISGNQKSVGTGNDLNDQHSIALGGAHTLDLFGNISLVIDRLRVILYQFLALPCDPIDNVKPVAEIFPELFPPEAKNPTRSKIDKKEGKETSLVSIVKKSANTTSAQIATSTPATPIPTHHDGSIGLIDLPIIPHCWSPIDLKRDFSLPHWTQVFYYNTALLATLQSDLLTDNVLTPMVYSGLSFSKVLVMVGKVVAGMLKYPTLLRPNIAPVLQYYPEYCQFVDTKRRMRYEKYGTGIRNELGLDTEEQYEKFQQRLLEGQKHKVLAQQSDNNTNNTTSIMPSFDHFTQLYNNNNNNNKTKEKKKSHDNDDQSDHYHTPYSQNNHNQSSQQGYGESNHLLNQDYLFRPKPPNASRLLGPQQPRPNPSSAYSNRVKAATFNTAFSFSNTKKQLNNQQTRAQPLTNRTNKNKKIVDLTMDDHSDGNDDHHSGGKRKVPFGTAIEDDAAHKKKTNPLVDPVAQALEYYNGKNKNHRYLLPYTSSPVHSHFKYLSSWRGTSAIATVLVCPWDIITAYFHVTRQVSDYDTTYCELHNMFFSKPHTFSTKVGGQKGQESLLQLIGGNEALLSNTKTTTSTMTISDPKSAISQLKSEYAIDLGFIARLLRYFQSDLTSTSFYNHNMTKYENDNLALNAYMNLVSREQKQYKSMYLPGSIENRSAPNDKTQKLIDLYFPKSLHFFQSTPFHLPSSELQIISFCIEPDHQKVKQAHQQYQNYKKHQAKQRQIAEANSTNGTPQTPSSKNKNGPSTMTRADLTSIFKMYLKSWSSTGVILPTNNPSFGFIYPYDSTHQTLITGDFIPINSSSGATTPIPQTPSSSRRLVPLAISTPQSSRSQHSTQSGHNTPTAAAQSSVNSLSLTINGTPTKLRATPLKSTPSVKSSSLVSGITANNNNNSAAGLNPNELHETITTLQAPMSSFNIPTVSTSLSFFQTSSLLNQYLSTLSCHSLGLIAAALRLEFRGEMMYSFSKLFEEHLSFLHSWSLNQPNINPLELFSTYENCLELHEQLVVDQMFVYCTKLNVNSGHTRQLNLDIFIQDDDDNNGTNASDGSDDDGDDQRKKKQRLAIIHKGLQPNQIIAIHPLQHQMHQFIKNNNPSAVVNADNQSTTAIGGRSGGASSSSQTSLMNKVKIQCVVSRTHFSEFLREYRIHLTKVRYIDPLNYESVPVWVDSLLDTGIKTTSNV